MKKLAVITGASQGIGACLTLALAARDLNVIVIARQKDLLEKLKAHYPDRINIITAV